MANIRQPIVTVCGHVDHGKCVSGDTIIPLIDGTLITAKELFENNFNSKEAKRVEDGILQDITVKRIRLFSLEKNKIIPKTISHIWRRKANTLIEIKTTAGDIIKTTPEHPYFIFSIEGPKEKQASELKEGEYIAIPKKIATESQNPKKEIINRLSKLNDFICFLNKDFEECFSKLKENNLREIERKTKIKHLGDSVRKKDLD